MTVFVFHESHFAGRQSKIHRSVEVCSICFHFYFSPFRTPPPKNAPKIRTSTPQKWRLPKPTHRWRVCYVDDLCTKVAHYKVQIVEVGNKCHIIKCARFYRRCSTLKKLWLPPSSFFVREERLRILQLELSAAAVSSCQLFVRWKIVKGAKKNG